MVALRPAWESLEPIWVTLAGVEVDSVLAGETVVIGYGPAVGNRRLRDVLRNTVLAWQVVRRYDPEVILSTGAGLAVPFFLVGKLRRRRLVYVESLSRVRGLSLTGWAVYVLADSFFVQWPTAKRRRAHYVGSVV